MYAGGELKEFVARRSTLISLQKLKESLVVPKLLIICGGKQVRRLNGEV